jgi:excisionase family DNA binding protein
VEQRTQTGSRSGRATVGAVETTSRLLSAQAAARYLGVPYTSLRDWALRGHIPIVRVPECRRLWFDRKDLDRAIDAWKERAPE